MTLPNDFNRRRLLQGAGVTALGSAPVLLAACGDGSSSVSSSDEANDLKIVEAGRAREQEMVGLYTGLVQVAPPDAKPLVQEILTQEQAHVTGLATVITDLGGKPAQADAQKAPPPANWKSGLVTVLGREQAIAGTYITEVSRLTIGDLRATWTSLATSSAQHTSILFGFTFPNDPSAQVQTAVVRGL